MQDWLEIGCPYCGERIELAVDASGGDQQYVEDCQVCCRPISILVRVEEDGGLQLLARRDDEA